MKYSRAPAAAVSPVLLIAVAGVYLGAKVFATFWSVMVIYTENCVSFPPQPFRLCLVEKVRSLLITGFHDAFKPSETGLDLQAVFTLVSILDLFIVQLCHF